MVRRRKRKPEPATAEESMNLGDRGEDRGLEVDDEATVEVVERPLRDRLSEENSELHGDLLTWLRDQRRASEDIISRRYSDWLDVDNHNRMYIDPHRKARLANKELATDELENPFRRAIVIPATYAALQVRLVQEHSIFTARDPIIELFGNGEEDIDSAQVLEAVLAYDSREMGMGAILWSWLSDAENYGLGVIYDAWEEEMGYQIERPQIDLRQVPERLRRIARLMFPMLVEPRKTWGTIREGCRAWNVDPFNFWPDPNAPVGKPELWNFAGHRFYRYLNWLEQRASAPDSPYFNIDKVPEKARAAVTNKRLASTTAGTEREGLGDASQSSSGVGKKARAQGPYAIDHYEARLVPREHELSPSGRVERWKFEVVGDAVIVMAEQAKEWHQRVPYSVIEVNQDPHVTFNQGSGEMAVPIQNLLNWLANSHFENVRRALNNASGYLPSMIEEADLLYPQPTGHVRPSLMGEEKIINGELTWDQVLHQLQVHDVTGTNIQDAGVAWEWMQRMLAASDPQLSIALASKRTATEINTLTTQSSQRVGSVTKRADEQGMRPFARRMIANRQQFTTIERYYRVTGSLARRLGIERIFAGSYDLYGDFDYVEISGLTPSDPETMAQTWFKVFEIVTRTPQLSQGPPGAEVPDIMAIFKQGLRVLGVRNIDAYMRKVPMPMPAEGQPGAPPQFRVMPDQEVARQEQAGNIVPMGGAQ